MIRPSSQHKLNNPTVLQSYRTTISISPPIQSTHPLPQTVANTKPHRLHLSKRPTNSIPSSPSPGQTAAVRTTELPSPHTSQQPNHDITAPSPSRTTPSTRTNQPKNAASPSIPPPGTTNAQHPSERETCRVRYLPTSLCALDARKRGLLRGPYQMSTLRSGNGTGNGGAQTAGDREEEMGREGSHA